MSLLDVSRYRPGSRRQRLTRSVDAKVSSAGIQQESIPVEQPVTPVKTVTSSTASANTRNRRPPPLQLAGHGSASQTTPVCLLAIATCVFYAFVKFSKNGD